MRVSYQHANVRGGNESTLLRFADADGRRACVLVDVGDGVDLDELLADDEYVNAIVLTHAHIDHYLTLGKNLRHNAPIYASPATARILERALPEARKDNDVGDVGAALDALEPIDDWTQILPNLDVRPVPAGHAPGAAGFLFRFEDEDASEADPFAGVHHLLVTGDFTRRPCAGYPGLQTSYPFDVDAVVLNVATDDKYERVLDDALRTVFERALAGARIVVAAGSLTGVHFATLLGTAAADLDRSVPVTLVGQAARLDDALDVDTPGVEAYEVFDRPSEVLGDGQVTIAGPANARSGSAKRLFEAIADDPGAVFVQLTADTEAAVDPPRCTTHSYRLSNHPTAETVESVIEELAPIQVVLKHASGGRLKSFQRRFDRCFAWGGTDEQIHHIYDRGEWITPDWISDAPARQIRQRRWNALQEHPADANRSVPSVEPGDVDLDAEGIDLDGLRAAFVTSTADPYATTDDGTAVPPGASSADESGATDVTSTTGESPKTVVTGATDGGSSVDTVTSGDPEPAVVPGSDASSDGVSDDSTDDPADGSAGETSNDTFERSVLERLEAIERRLENTGETVSARVLDGGDEQLIRLLERVDIEPGDTVTVTIDRHEHDAE